MRKTVVIAGGVLALAVGVVGGSYYVGGKIEDDFRAGVERIRGAGFDVRVLDYRRGVFGAQAETLWTLPSEEEPLSFTLAHAVSHGPLPAGKAAEIRTTLQLDAEASQALAPLLQGREPLEILSKVSWGGDHSHTLNVVDYRGPVEESEIVWGGMQGTVDVTSGGKATRGSLSLPVLTVRDPAGKNVDLQKAAITFDTTQPQDYHFWTGQALFSIERLAVGSGAPEQMVEVEGLGLTSSTALEGDLASTTIEFKANRFSGGGEVLQAPGVTLSLQRLDAGVLDAASRMAQEGAAVGEDIQAHNQRLLAAMMSQLPALLARSPVVEIKNLGATLPEGVVKADLRLAYVGKPGGLGFNPLVDVEGQANLALPQPLLERVLSARARQELERYMDVMDLGASEEEIADAVDETVRTRMEALTAQGVLVPKDGQWVSALEYKGGVLSINGNQTALGALGAMGLPL